MILFNTRRSILIITALFFMQFAAAPPSSAQENPREYAIKAAFIYNFVKFVRWPESAIQPSGALTLCVTGADPFGPLLEKLAEKSRATENKLTVRRGIGPEDAAQCHIVFVGDPDGDRLERVLDAVKGKPVLTVGDAPEFAHKGVAINFFIQDNKVRFEINVGAARRSGLAVSSELLNLARIVEGGPGK
ncbi:MAG: YfiR family protein [Nitrospinae bacterium]|nr:YfiR family protein [Nitrospinota bacterium]